MKMGAIEAFFLTALILILLQPSPGSASQSDSPLSWEKQHRLAEKISRSGSVRLLVNLSLESEPVLKRGRKAFSGSADLRSRRTAAVRRIQQRVAGRIGRTHRLLRRFRHQPTLVVEADQALLDHLKQDPEVERIEEDRLFRPTLTQSVPLVGADVAAAAGFDGDGFAVAILDTGVQTSHSFFAGRVMAEACFSTTYPPLFTTSLCPDGTDEQTGIGSGVNCSGVAGCDHGTHVAGIAVGTSNSFSGVAPGAGLIAIQVFSRIDDPSYCGSSSCIAAFYSDLIAAMEYLYDNRDSLNVAAVNMSLGGGLYTSPESCDADNLSVKVAIDDLRASGIATVIASGNEYQSGAISAPGCISSAVSVGATTSADQVASFSNGAYWLSLLAPGTGIYSSEPVDDFGNKQGTSISTPHVSGAFAVLKSSAPTATVDETLAALASTGVPVLDTRNDVVTPRIQVDAAAYALADTHPVTVTVDNQDPNTSSTGVWRVSSGPYPWNGQSLYSDSNGRFRWSPDLGTGGSFELYAWWTYHRNRSTNVPYEISHALGIDRIEVNQRDGSLAGQWVLLGVYNFDGSGNDYVEVSSENGQASADAVRFVATVQAVNQPPQVAIDSPEPGSTFYAGELITFSASASDHEDGPLDTAIEWSSDLDGPIGNGQRVASSSLSPGSHQVSARVTDSGGLSAEHSLPITIAGPPGTEQIIDDRDASTSRVGTWRNSSGANPWDGRSLYNNAGGSFRWEFRVPTNNKYQVYAWWTFHSGRANRVPYSIRHLGGTHTVEVNQQDASLAGQWNLLGNFSFEPGQNYYVEVASEYGQASADAIRLVAGSPSANLAPEVTITSPSEGASFASGDLVTLAGEAIDLEDGDLSISLSWSSDRDGHLGTGTDIQSPGLSDGTHLVTATVTDSAGESNSDSVAFSITPSGATEIIVDNLDDATTFTGNWRSSSGPDPWDGHSAYNNNGNSFRWTPDISEPGSYAVYVWWTYHRNRSDNVPYHVAHSGNITAHNVNQRDQSLAGRWFTLGTYLFAADGSEYVEVSSANGQASADAIRLVRQ